MSLRRTVVILAVGVAVASAGLILTRHMIAVAGEMDAGEAPSRSILEYIAQKNPRAPIGAFQRFPEVLMAEAQRTSIDHCLALAQAGGGVGVQAGRRGRGGQIGIFQIKPSTAAIFEPAGRRPFKRPVLVGTNKDLGDLADPVVSTRFAMAYLRDIMTRKSNVKDALTECNGGPAGRHPSTTAWSWAPTSRCWSARSCVAGFREARPSRCPPLTTLLSRA